MIILLLVKSYMHKFQLEVFYIHWSLRERVCLFRSSEPFSVFNNAVPTDHWVKVKESKIIDKYLNFARYLNYLQNMKMTVSLVIVDRLVTVPNNAMVFMVSTMQWSSWFRFFLWFTTLLVPFKNLLGLLLACQQLLDSLSFSCSANNSNILQNPSIYR